MLRVSQIFHQIIGGFFQVIEHIQSPLPPTYTLYLHVLRIFHVNKIGIRKRVDDLNTPHSGIMINP